MRMRPKLTLMSPTIRPARPQDTPEILQMIQALAVYEKEPDAVRNTAEQLQVHLFGPHPAIFAHVVDAPGPGNGQLAGFALWFLNYSTWEGTHGIYLEDLYVREQHRGQGYGKALLQHLASIAVARGYHRVEWSVLDWNQPSIDFYRYLGAYPMDGWHVFRLDGPALQSFGTSQDSNRPEA